MKALVVVVGVLLILTALPIIQPLQPQAIVSGPEACALCSQFPQYCNACYLFLWVVSLDPENWEMFLE